MLLGIQMSAQVIYVSTSDFDVYALDLNDCSLELVVDINSSFDIFDISFHPNGNLYGIAPAGQLIQIDIVTGSTSVVHTFSPLNFNPYFLTSLTVAGDGTIYTIGNEGKLYSYNIATGSAICHGNIGYPATGDLTFYDGNLYVAANDNNIVQVDIDNPSNSSVVVNGDINGRIFGIVSFANDCNDVNVYAITNGDSQIYEINFEDNSLDFVCGLDVEVFGGASTFEFLGSSPINIEDLTQISPNCGLNDGVISIDVTGGTGQIVYSIDGTNFQPNGLFENLPEGIYTITISDDINCTITQVVNLLGANKPEITNVSLSNEICNNANGSITISATGGTGQVEYSLDGIDFQLSNNFENLAAGTYTIIIRDADNCQDTESTNIANESPEFEAVETIPTACGESNGSIIIEPDGGGIWEYSIDGTDYQQSNVFSNLISGTYTAFIRNEDSCTAMIDVEIDDISTLEIVDIEVSPEICKESNGSLTFSVEGATGLLQTSLNGENFQPDLSFNNLAEGTYEIQIMDENGCSISTAVFIDAEPCPVYVPNIFSPNNDGNNDVFRIYPHPNFTGSFQTFRVYDRWGSLLYEAQNFTPEDMGWDGTHKGQELGIGVYLYYVQYIDENGELQLLQGDITIAK